MVKTFDLETVSGLLREAGTIALRYYENPAVEVKSDRTVVTVADRAIEALLATAFDRPQEDSYLIGEETVATRGEAYLQAALNAPACWIVDPIDGTACYTAQLPVWAVSVAFASHGVITAGAIYMVVQDDCLALVDGVIMHRALRRDDVWRPFRIMAHALDDSGHVGVAQRLLKTARLTMPNQVFSWSACVGSIYWIMTGRMLAYAATVKLWDIAAWLPMLQAAGFAVRKRNGDEVSCRLADGYFELADRPGRWRLHDGAVVAPTAEIADYVWKHIE